jgi:Glycosyl transferase family 2
MRVRCRRGHLVLLIPLLVVLSIAINWYLFLEHRSAMDGMSSLLGNHTEQSAVAEFFNQKKRRKANGRPHRKKKGKMIKEGIQVEPREESLSPNATFSACLLIKDDNDILNEWLAYHYHVINLRHLIVAVDPLSSESPSQILKKWKELTDLEVFEWTDAHFMSSQFLTNHKPPRKYMQKRSDFDYVMTYADLLEISNHRYRQRVFLAKCMKALRQRGNTWVIHIDTDEYVTTSKLLRQMNPDYLDAPKIEVPGSVLSLLQQTVRKTPDQVSYPCISMLRVLFGSVESSNRDRYNQVPPGFNASSFETLRWRYHALPHNMTWHGNPKVILDVSAIPESHVPDDIVYSIHRPVEKFCHKNKELTFTNFRRQPIAVNHYLGSWERYNGRNDKRRSRDVYDAKANVKRGQDDGIRPWLRGFLSAMGSERAVALLGTQYLSSNGPNVTGAQYLSNGARNVTDTQSLSDDALNVTDTQPVSNDALNLTLQVTGTQSLSNDSQNVTLNLTSTQSLSTVAVNVTGEVSTL